MTHSKRERKQPLRLLARQSSLHRLKVVREVNDDEEDDDFFFKFITEIVYNPIQEGFEEVI